LSISMINGKIMYMKKTHGGSEKNDTINS